MELDFEQIEKRLLDYKAKSEYKQAAIIMVRNIFKEAEKEQLKLYGVVGRSEQLVCVNHRPDLEHFMLYSESICKNCKQKV